jgi:hypothetical protein
MSAILAKDIKWNNDCGFAGKPKQMKKTEQKRILDMVHTLGEANGELRRLYAKADSAGAYLGLLADCQSCAFALIANIDEIEGKGTATVGLLEAYAEILNEANAAGPESADGKINELKKSLCDIENSVRNELRPDRLEIVFFPYQLSMWDSLESVYIAAKADPGCDAYVVPIPWFEKLPSGEFGRMHYDGDLYPANIEVTDWREYDIEARQPDAVFVHNPYDDGNLVTGVHPDFYCKWLKQFTDLLVYIPYFVCSDDVGAHFCVCAGTLYADLVIVQSEKIRRTYMREFRKFESNNNCKGRFGRAEDKFLAYGSPKFDKVLNTGREDCILPEAWKRRIVNADGTCKKVIFYNTTVGAILRDNAQYLKKLRYVFDIFRERRDVVLWWRPHPLSEQTIGSMRPQLAAEYRKIVAEYRRTGQGIFDDTPDLHRAIAWSDVYYGDWSSVVILYKLAGKPVVVQDTGINERNDNWKKLAFESLYDDGEYLWFPSFEDGAIYRMSKSTFEAELICRAANEDGISRGYYSMAKCNGKLYFAPLLAREMAVYDSSAGVCGKVPLVDDGFWVQPKSESFRFIFVIVPHRQYLFLAGGYPAIMRYNTETGHTDYFDDWLCGLRELMFDKDKFYFTDYALGECPDLLILSCPFANATVLFNMETCTSEIIGLGRKKEGFSRVCRCGDIFWFARAYSPSVLKLNLATREFKEIGDFPAGFGREAGAVNFSGLLYEDGFVWMFPSAANMVLKINVSDDSVSMADGFQDECGHAYSGNGYLDINYMCALADGNAIYAFAAKTKKLIRYDRITGRCDAYPIYIPKEALEYREQKPAERNALSSVHIVNAGMESCKTLDDSNYYEYKWCSLQDILNFFTKCGDNETARHIALLQRDCCRGLMAYPDGVSGEKIYEYLKNITIGEGVKIT